MRGGEEERREEKRREEERREGKGREGEKRRGEKRREGSRIEKRRQEIRITTPYWLRKLECIGMTLMRHSFTCGNHIWSNFHCKCKYHWSYPCTNIFPCSCPTYLFLFLSFVPFSQKHLTSYHFYHMHIWNIYRHIDMHDPNQQNRHMNQNPLKWHGPYRNLLSLMKTWWEKYKKQEREREEGWTRTLRFGSVPLLHFLHSCSLVTAEEIETDSILNFWICWLD